MKIEGREIRVSGLMILHYGCEYVGNAIQSIYPVCDEIIILYTERPSHSHGTDMACPETEQQLKDAIKPFDPDKKIIWINGIWDGEGTQRNYGMEMAKANGSAIIVVADSDEIWNTDSLRKAIPLALATGCRQNGINGFIHFFRDFNHVCRDGFTPIRLINPNAPAKTEAVVDGTIYHFGYTISEQMMRYKFEIHGHKPELIPNWIDEVYLNPNRMEDLHPVAHGIWNAEKFDKNELPEHLHSHPNYSK